MQFLNELAKAIGVIWMTVMSMWLLWLACSYVTPLVRRLKR
jgi:hypothetical protein